MFDAEDLLFLGSELALVGLRVFYGEFLLICTAYQYSYLQKNFSALIIIVFLFKIKYDLEKFNV